MNVVSESVLPVAEKLGARLCRDAFWAGDRCNWIGTSMEFVRGDWQVVHRAFGPELYNGTSGIGLFLTHLHMVTGEPLFRRTAEGALRQALRQRHDFAGHSRAGFYSGLLGLAHAALLLGRFSEDPVLHAGLPEVFDEMVALGPVAEGVDVVMGSAGAIPALINLHRRTGDDRLIALAGRHGDQLLEQAQRGDEFWSWDTLQGMAPRHLTGQAHGAAGIAWAFFELHAVTGDARHLEAAQRAIAYEQSVFNPEQGNWPDFRDHSDSGHTGDEPLYALAWCHGAPGIGLCRLRAFELTGETAHAEQAQIALQTTADGVSRTVQAGLGDFTYCHGTTGLLEPLLYGESVFPGRGYGETVRRVADWAAANYAGRNQPWPCGVLNGGETPNLMLGLAGIGYFFLRLGDPESVPNLLLFGPREA